MTLGPPGHSYTMFPSIEVFNVHKAMKCQKVVEVKTLLSDLVLNTTND